MNIYKFIEVHLLGKLGIGDFILGQYT